MYINSVLNSFSIMRAFLGEGRSLSLKAISQQARMPPSKVHRYLQSLISCGMVSQDYATGRYALGPMTIEYGLAGLAKIDPVRRACQATAAIAAGLDIGVAVSVFSSAGPVFIFYEEPDDGTQYHVRIGTTTPLLSSSSGHVFLAWLPRDQMLAHVRTSTPAGSLRGIDVDGLIHRVRTAGYATESASYSQPVYGLSAPIFNPVGDIAAAMTFFSHSADLLDRNGRFIRALLDETRRLSLAGGEVLRGPPLAVGPTTVMRT